MLLCNQTDPDMDMFFLQPCLQDQDLNQITLCFRKVVTHVTGIWRAENSSSLALPAFITQLIAILTLNRILTIALRPLHVPRIAAEILGGLILGPSGIGFTDLAVKYIIPWGTVQTLENIASLGVVYFMFIVGLEVDLKLVLRAGKKPLTTAVAGILLPFPIGYALHHLIQNFSLGSARPVSEFGPLFWGLALATTNFPDLAGLLADLKLLHTDVGRTALASATVSDLLCWCIFIPTMASSHKGRIFTVASTSVFTLFAVFGLRPCLKWALRRSSNADGSYTRAHVYFVMAGVLVFALVTDACGSQSIFGAFMLGVILPKGEIKTLMMESVEDFVQDLLIPLFFFCIGLRTDWHWIFERGVGAGSVVLVIVLAFIAKIFSTFFVAFFVNKMPARDGVALGLLMNTKGLLSLIILNAGRDLKALDMQTFGVMMFSLWIMTAVVGPILFFTYKSKKRLGLYKFRTIRSIEGNAEFRILACLHSSRNSGGLVALLRASNPSKSSPVAAFAVHLVELVGHASTMLIVHDACKPSTAGPAAAAEGVAEALEGLVGESFSVKSLTAVSAYNTMHEDICGLAEDKHATLVVLPFHLQTATADGCAAVPESSANSPFRAVNVNVLDKAPCSVAVFVDRGFSARADDGRSRWQFAVLFVGGRDDREALAYAWRMANSPRTGLTVIRFVAGKTNPEVPGFGSDDEGDDDEEILKAMAEMERERPLDEQYIEEFKLKTRDNMSMRLVELVAENGEEVVQLVSSLEIRYDIYVVGRGKGVVSPLTSGLSEWSEYPELGPLGDILVCSSFAADASVLVVQQGAAGPGYQEEGVGQVKEQFGHMTWHPPETNKGSYAPFIHRRVRLNDDDDHL